MRGERLWIAALGQETVYEADLPACCRRTAGTADNDPGDPFECPSCGAMWQAPIPVEPEGCAFAEDGSERRERKGAA